MRPICKRLLEVFIIAGVTTAVFSCKTDDSSSDLESKVPTGSHALDTPDNAIKVKRSISSELIGKFDVNGVGVTGCNPKTGERDVNHSFVHCILVYVATDDGYKQVIKRYPVGKKVNGVFVTVEKIGEIRAQPRASSGN